MKLNKWLYGVTALAMLAACSDKDIAPGGGEDEMNPGEVGSGYLAVQINLPQDAGTRAPVAGGNDNFDDGTPNEYNVDNAMIIIFKGKDEKSAKFCKAQDLKRPWFTNKEDENKQITSSYLAAVKVNDLTQTEIKNKETYWGLVILNRNGSTTGITTDETADVLENTSEVKIGGVKIDSSKTFQDVLNIVTTNSFLSVAGTGDNAVYNNFFMTNAPLSTVAGGGSSTQPAAGDIHYLVDLGQATYATIEEARNNVENCIYVERAVAKVTCANEGKYTFKLYDENGELVADSYKVKATVKYALTNTNKKSYVVRNVDFTDNHFKWDYSNKSYKRMVGEVAMPKLDSPYHEVEQSFYRTYWCLDPNYALPMPAEEKHVFDPATNANDVFVSIDKPLYCKENTFDVKHQSYFNTTMALFQVDFGIVTNDDDEAELGDGNLYIKNEDTSVIYISANAAASQEIARIKDDANIIKALEEAAKASGLKGTVENATQYLDINFELGKDNYLNCTSISLKSAPGVFNAAGIAKFKEIMGVDAEDGGAMAALIDNVNNMSEITVYEDGTSYYLQPIMHFGKIHCPLDNENEFVGTTTKDVYNKGEEFKEGGSDTDIEHARRYLGRYGVVRNNWYELNISNFTALGSPTVPDIDVDLSDDNKEVKKYIGVEIHVLSWAKRTQSYDF